MQAKPILKWAGGKTQLVSEIVERIPPEFRSGQFTYVEPFIGGGAMFFWVKSEYPNVEAVISDLNPDLINCYIQVQSNVEALIECLYSLENSYKKASFRDEEKKILYYKIRDEFNLRNAGDIERAAQLIFLNKTCFNGLYRVNRKGDFNVPIGSYKNPKICDSTNLRLASIMLRNVTILNGDYAATIDYAGGHSLFYLDPPYKPISSTSSFNAYAKTDFNDDEQIRLFEFCRNLDQKGSAWILSNSDVNLEENPNGFFDELYVDFNIQRVNAKRAINSVSSKRGSLSELLISNSICD